MASESNGKGHAATERTGLLDSGAGTNYSGEQQRVHVDIEAGAYVAGNDDQPRVPVELLVKTVRKTIRQHNKAKLYIQEQKELAARRQAAAAVARPQRQDSNVSDSSSSDSDSDAAESVLGTRRRKRDIISNALKSATDQWKQEHGWGSSSSLFDQKHKKGHHHHLFHRNHDDNQDETSSSKPAAEPAPEQGGGESPVPSAAAVVIPTLPPLEHDVWNVARAASVCTLLAIARSKQTNGSWEKLALSSMDYCIKASASASSPLMREMLIRPWVDGRSAIEWAVANDCQHFLADPRIQSIVEDCWRSRGMCEDWQQVPHHPCRVWRQLNCPGVLRPIASYLARWSTPRYQAMASLLVGLVYLGLHLATLANSDYGNDGLHPFEYAYYVFVGSDVLLEFGSLLFHPIASLRHPSTYLSLTTAGLLTASMVLRVVGLAGDMDLEHANAYLVCSYILLVWATPLMVFRLVLWQDNLCWSVSKTRYLVSRCVVDALWVFGLALVTLVAFWIGLAALQHDDLDCLTLLRYLALGALHAPAIPNTLYYQPQAAGVMLFFYLAAMLLVLGALLTGSFLTTLIALYPRLGAIHNTFAAERAVVKRPGYGVLIPTVAIDAVAGFAGWILTGLFKMDKDASTTLLWLERIRQVLWILVFSPVILLVGIIELLCYGLCRARRAWSGYVHLQ